MTRARLRRGVRKRREAREARERKARRVWAASLPPPPIELIEGPKPCPHSWGDPVRANFSGEGLDVDVIRVCETCHGYSCEDVNDAVGFICPMQGRAENTQCLGGFPSRGSRSMVALAGILETCPYRSCGCPMVIVCQSLTLRLTRRSTESRDVSNWNGLADRQVTCLHMSWCDAMPTAQPCQQNVEVRPAPARLQIHNLL